ncbi:MAG: type II toxin-antitoxin system prevent-host-death family antitoxin, partial [Lachnospiraceae bacterium]|nr:type II toxin-antitoxin system prevent-host-death family antitoxin [Lachnospiraceae bacterium]
MVIAKQMDVRANIKKYFDIAFDGEPVIVPRKNNRNVVIVSEADYKELE